MESAAQQAVGANVKVKGYTVYKSSVQTGDFAGSGDRSVAAVAGNPDDHDKKALPKLK
jgi:hypothetical protein